MCLCMSENGPRGCGCVQSTRAIHMTCRYTYGSARVYRCKCVRVCVSVICLSVCLCRQSGKSAFDGNDISVGNLPGLHPSRAGAAVC